jgi:hypothetical protein
MGYGTLNQDLRLLHSWYWASKFSDMSTYYELCCVFKKIHKLFLFVNLVMLETNIKDIHNNQNTTKMKFYPGRHISAM